MKPPGSGADASPAVPPAATDLAEALVQAGGGSVVAVLLYGSQLHRSSPGLHSAWDLVVVLRRYDVFHRAMRAEGYQTRSSWIMNTLGGVMAPYVTAFAPRDAGGRIAKCLVLTEAQFDRALAPDAPDHFLKGRMVQHVEVVWAESEQRRMAIHESLAAVRQDVLRWAGPFLEEPFDATSVTRTMLEVSFAGEIRPERGDRVREVWESQRGWLETAFAEVLSQAAEAGVVTEEGAGGYRFARRADLPGRGEIERYFLHSKVRVTARWFKHIVTFNDWLTYIQRKAERRTGLTIEITRAERRWPLLLLWPKVFRVLREGRGTHGNTESPE